MNFLVTGAAGFIGSDVCRRLIILGHNVVGVDNFNDYYSSSLKKHRTKILLETLNLKVANLDLININDVKKLFKKKKFDSIIHLAAQPGVRTPMEKSSRYIQSNLVGYSNLLQTSILEGVPTFVYASSSSVYGHTKSLVFKEDEPVGLPTSIYGATKQSNEILASAYVSGSQTKTRGLRFFTVYGPWGRPDMAYFRIISAALNNSTFEIFGDGEIRRDFTFISDISESIIALSLELNNEAPGFSDVVNIGGGEPKSINELIDVVNEICNSSLQVKYSKSNKSDISQTCADTSLLKSLIQKDSFVSLFDGITETINWATEPNVRRNLELWVKSTV